jgi:predicted transcriptional regulator
MDELGDYMNSSILSIDHESSVHEAEQYMKANHIQLLMVKKFGKFVGIVTDTDLTCKVLSPEVRTIMTPRS